MTHRRAVTYLQAADPVLAGIIRLVGPCRLVPRAEGTHFDALVRSIVFQQLSTRAASTIHGRVLALYGDRSPTPAELLATPESRLREAGLSRQKLGYLRDLAARVESGDVVLDGLERLGDDGIIDTLVRVKGVGRWTAHMFLIFRLGRPDVLPELDLGVRTAIRRAYRLRKLPTIQRTIKIGSSWAPYRSVASWYLWRSLENGGAS